MAYPLLRSLLCRTPLPRLLSTASAAAVEDFWRLLRSDAASHHTTLERLLSLSKADAGLTPAVVESVLRLPSASVDDGDRSLALRFFIWAGLQPRYRHSAAAYSTACDALHLPRHPQLLPLLLDSYRDSATPVSLRTFKILLNLCRHASFPDEALSLLRRMPEFDCRPDTSSYNAVLRLLAECGRVEAAAALLDEVATAGLSPDMTTFVSSVRAIASAGKVEAARSLVGQMPSNGCVPNVVVYSALVDGACAAGDVNSAMKILEEMEGKLYLECIPNVVTYTCLIKCLCQKGQLEEAIAILDRMERRGCSPNQVTIRTLVDGLCAGGRIGQAYQLIEKVAGEGFISANECYSILLVSLLMVKDVKEAIRVFGIMLDKDVKPSGLAVNSLMRKLCEELRFLDVYNLVLKLEEKWFPCIDSDVYSDLLFGICKDGHSVKALRLLEKIVEREILLSNDCIDCVIPLVNKAGDHNLASKIIRLKQPHGP